MRTHLIGSFCLLALSASLAQAQNGVSIPGLLNGAGGASGGVNAGAAAGALGVDLSGVGLTDALNSGLNLGGTIDSVTGGLGGNLPALGGLPELPALGQSGVPFNPSVLSDVIGDSLPAGLLPADAAIPLSLLDPGVVSDLFNGSLPLLPGGVLPSSVPAGALPDGMPVPLSAINPDALASTLAAGVPAGALPGNFPVPVSVLDPAVVQTVLGSGVSALPASTLPAGLALPVDALDGLDPALLGAVTDGRILAGALPDDLPIPTAAIDPAALSGILGSSIPAGLLPARLPIPMGLASMAADLPGLTALP